MLVHRVWHPAEREPFTNRRQLRRRKIIAGTILIAAICFLVFLAFRPFWHPRTYMLFLTGGEYQPLRAEPLRFVYEDYYQLTPLLPALSAVDGSDEALNLEVFGAANELRTRFAEIADLPVGSNDVLLIYLSARVTERDGKIFLVPGDFQTTSNRGGIDIEFLLESLQRNSAGTKVLIWDERSATDSDVATTFVPPLSERLQAGLDHVDDPSLCVLVSHSPGEFSHVSPALQRSVFAYMVTRGLMGAGDDNGDQCVDLIEFTNYVSGHVSAWVSHVTDRRATQTPVLYRAANPRGTGRNPVLISTSAVDASVLDRPVAESVAQAHDPQHQGGLSRTVSGQATGAARTYRDSLVRQLGGGYRTQVAMDRASTLGRQESSADESPGGMEAGRKEVASTEPSSPVAGDTENESSDRATGSETTAKSPQRSNATADLAGQAGEFFGASTSALDDSQRRRVLLGELVNQGWQLRDSLLQQEYPDPLHYAPQLWRVLEHQLVWYDLLSRSGAIAGDQEAFEGLLELVESLQLFVDGELQIIGEPRNVVERLSQRVPNNRSDVTELPTLAMMELVWSMQGGAEDEELAEAILSFDDAIQADTPNLLDEWMEEKWRPEFALYREFQLARRLAAVQELSWETARQAIATRRLSEKVATLPAITRRWLKNNVIAADRILLSAERGMIDQISPEWREDVRRKLTQADRDYRAISKKAAIVEDAGQLLHKLLHRGPEYLSLWEVASVHAAGHSISFENLDRLLKSGLQLARLLDSQSQDSIGELQEAVARVRIGLERIDEWINSLIQPTTAPSDQISIVLDRLLRTSIPTAADRQALRRREESSDAEKIVRFDIFADYEGPANQAPSVPGELNHLYQVLYLRGKLLQIAIPTGRFSQLALPELAVLSERAGRATSSPGADRQQNRELLANAHHAMTTFLAELPNEIERTIRVSSDLRNPQDRRSRLAALESAKLAVRSLPASFVKDIDSPLDELLERSDWYDSLSWQRQRALIAIDDAPPSEIDNWRDIANQTAQRGNRIPNQPAIVQQNEDRLELVIPGTVNLNEQPSVEIPVEINWLGREAMSVWLLVDYDPSSVNVTGVDTTPWYPLPRMRRMLEEQLSAAIRALDEAALANGPNGQGIADGTADSSQLPGGNVAELRQRVSDLRRAVQYPERPDLGGLQPSLVLSTRGTSRPMLRIGNLRQGVESARIIIKAVSSSSYVRQMLHLRRHPQETVRLVARVDAGDWRDAPGGILIQPLPNHPFNVAFSLVNEDSKSRPLSAELFASDHLLPKALPIKGVNETEFTNLLASIGPLQRLATSPPVDVAAGGTSAFVPQAPAENQLQPNGTAPVPSSDQAATAPEPNGADSPAVIASQGLLMVITDVTTRQRFLRLIRFAPQRPRRYLAVRASYNAALERIEFRIAPTIGQLPPEGIEVECRFLGGLPSPGQSRLKGKVESADSELLLFAEVPIRLNHTATALIDVNGYPRAFTYEIPCVSQANNIAETADTLSVRLLEPLPNAHFRAPLDKISARLAVDAPVGTFNQPNGNDRIELGIDTNRDRLLGNEPTVLLFPDRSVKIELTNRGELGSFSFSSTVADHEVEIPADGLVDIRANLLARVFAGGRSAWSRPAEVVFDASGPRIERVELNPGRQALQSAELEVSAWIGEEEQSDVQTVEIAFDKDGDGEFSDGEAPTVGEIQAGPRWVAKTALAELTPGRHGLMVRATDSLGNVGDVKLVEVNVIGEGAAGAARNEVLGVIRYGRWAVSSAKVTLTPKSDRSTFSRTTFANDDGEFRVGNVPTGEYTLDVVGLAKNRPRFNSLDITIEAPPKPPTQVTIELD